MHTRPSYYGTRLASALSSGATGRCSSLSATCGRLTVRRERLCKVCGRHSACSASSLMVVVGRRLSHDRRSGVVIHASLCGRAANSLVKFLRNLIKNCGIFLFSVHYINKNISKYPRIVSNIPYLHGTPIRPTKQHTHCVSNT